MADYNHLTEPEAIRELATHTKDIKERLSHFAISYNINIITGSMPEVVRGKLYNVGYLCRRDGSVERFEKIHVTPDEERIWGMNNGSGFKVFDTDSGRIGVLV